MRNDGRASRLGFAAACLLGRLAQNTTADVRSQRALYWTSHGHSDRRRAGPWRRLWPYLARYRRSFALGLLCIVAATAIQLLSPWVLKHAVDDLAAGVTRGKLAYYAVLLLGLAVVGGVFRYLMRRVVIGVSRHIEYDLRNDFFAPPCSGFRSRITRPTARAT